MGKMVADTRAAIDALAAVGAVDASRISLMGYSLGAKVGLITAALDDRVHALAAVCGFDPLRRATADRGVEGIRHYSHLHGLMPRLGFLGRKREPAAFRFRRAPGAGRVAPCALRRADAGSVCSHCRRTGSGEGRAGSNAGNTGGLQSIRRQVAGRVCWTGWPKSTGEDDRRRSA
jgi:pimeloyl-ACP methyl ester carboxylesterase